MKFQTTSIGGADFRITKKDIQAFLENSNIFDTAKNITIDYPAFKKNFFP